MKLADMLQGMGKPATYYPSLRKLTGKMSATLFLCRIIWWSGKQKDDEQGWICKTAQEMEQETGLTRREQETARKVLKQKKLISEKRKGIPAKLYYRVNFKNLNAII